MAELKWVATHCQESLLPDLASMNTEEQVKERCQAEMQYWLSRGLLPNSLRTPHTQSRKLLEQSSLPAQVKAWALQHLSLGEEKWTEVNIAQSVKLASRKENQQLLSDPDRIVRQAEALLESERWQDMAAGLSAVTGRRVTEILKNAVFEPQTAYTVMFSGQLKQRSNEIATFEIPTLTDASKVIETCERLRAALDTTNMSESDVENKYHRAVNSSIKRHFDGLIPARDGDNITSHVLRAVYLRLAIFFFAPVLVDADHYAAMISGHRSYVGGQERLSYTAGANYSDYKIADKQGNLDGRQGVRLGQSGVEVLAVFSGSYKPVAGLSGALNGMVQAPLPVTGTLTPESLFTGEMLELVREGMTAAAETEFMRYLTTALKRQARADLGIARRDTVADVSRMSMEELTRTRKPATANERIRRAVQAIAAHNDSCTQMERWFINATLISNLIGGRFEAILDWLKEHDQEVANLNNKYNLTVAYNRKPIPVKDVISVE